MMGPWGLAVVWLIALGGLARAADPGPSFDCGKARTTVDRMVCANADLAALDRSLAEQYQHLLAGNAPDIQARLRDSQRAWLSGRAICVPEVRSSTTQEATRCLTDIYSGRLATLKTRYRRAGGLTIEQRSTTRSNRARRVTETDIWPALSGVPAAEAVSFNRYVASRLRPDAGLLALSGMKLEAKPPGETSFDRSYEIHHFDQRLISMEISTHHESYVGHGWRAEAALNWDLKTGRAIKVTDLFRANTEWHRAVMDHARTWLREDSDIADPDFLLTDDALDDDQGWLLGEDGGVLLLGRGERSMVGASADVPIPYEVLAPFLRPDGPLPIPR